MTLLESLMFLSIAALLIFTIWNKVALNNIRKRSDFNTALNDAKYFELKYKQEFLVAVFFMISTVLGVLGYNTVKSAEDLIKKDFDEKIGTTKINLKIVSDSTNNVNKMVTDLYKKSDNLQNQYNLLSSQLVSKQKQVINYKGEINELNQEIALLNSKNILKQNYYIVDNFYSMYYPLFTDPRNVLKTYYFKDFITSLGDKLPLFTDAPIISPMTIDGSTYELYEVTKESFQFRIASSPNIDSIKRTILLIYSIPK